MSLGAKRELTLNIILCFSMQVHYLFRFYNILENPVYLVNLFSLIKLFIDQIFMLSKLLV